MEVGQALIGAVAPKEKKLELGNYEITGVSELNAKDRLPVYADGVNLLGGNIHTKYKDRK
jgi:hypothetical protein